MGFIKPLLGIDFDQFKKVEHQEGRDNSLEGIKDGIHNHSYDLSTRDAIRMMNADAKDKDGKISGETMGKAIGKLADGGQISREEYADMREYVLKNWDNLSDDAKKLWDKLDTAYQKASKGDVGFGDAKNDGKLRSDAVLKGKELEGLLGDVKADPASKPKRSIFEALQDAVDAVKNEKDTKSEGTGGPSPKSPEEARTGGTGGTKSSTKAGGADGAEGIGDVSGMSWEAIFQMILAKMAKKETELKGLAKATAEKIDGAQADGKGTESLSQDLANIQGMLQKIKQMTEMVTNMSKTLHDTASAPIANLRV